MLHFQHIEYLFALIAISVLILLFFYVLNWKKNTIKKIGDERLVNEMIKNYSPKKFAIKFVLIVCAFASTVVALANLRTPVGSEKVSRNGIDVMIALDVSKSMLAQDIKPNRLERAKQLLGKLIDKLSNDRIGIVVFAGKAYLQMPLTADNGAAKMYLSSATPDVVPTQGTVIGDALKMCSESFNTKEKKYKAIILISDGEDHDEGAIKMAAKITEDGIIINTIGIGSPEGATIFDPATNEAKKDAEGNVVVTKLNEATLQSIAEKGKGIYQLFNNTDDVVSKLNNQLSTLDQRTVIEDSLVNYKNFFQYFLMISLLLLVTEFFIPERIKPNKNKINKALAKCNFNKKSTVNTTYFQSFIFGILLLTFCFHSFALHAQTENVIIKNGNDAYQKNDFVQAIDQYQTAIKKTPNNPIAQYNLGNALYKNNKIDDAIEAYDKVIANSKDNTDKAKAFYNKGVALQNNKKIPECIDAYKNALKLNPQDEEARQNLQKALKQQKNNNQQKKPKEDEKKKNQEKQKNEDKNQQPKPQPANITKKDAEEKLKTLLQQEKNLQDKFKKVNAAMPNKPEKDW